METKYCGNCGITDKETKFRHYMTCPDGEKTYICRDRKTCDARLNTKLAKKGKS